MWHPCLDSLVPSGAIPFREITVSLILSLSFILVCIHQITGMSILLMATL